MLDNPSYYMEHITEDDLSWLLEHKKLYSSSLQRPFEGTIETQKEWFKTLNICNMAFRVYETPRRSIGFYYAKNIDYADQSHDFTYWVDKDTRGLGLAKIVLQRGLYYSFESLGMKRVYGQVLANNWLSIRTMVNCGFKPIPKKKSVCIKDGKEIDLIMMEISK